MILLPVAYAIDPSLFKTQEMPVYVVTDGRSAGDTVPDPQHQVD
jgi:inosine-uridine nucleoside N-ribohydrolase